MCILSIKDITDETKNVYKNSVRLCYSFLYTVESEPSVYVFYSMLYVLYVHAPMQMRIRRWAGGRQQRPETLLPLRPHKAPPTAPAPPCVPPYSKRRKPSKPLNSFPLPARAHGT